MTGPMSAEQAKSLTDAALETRYPGTQRVMYGLGRSTVIAHGTDGWHACVEGKMLGPFLTDAEAVQQAEEYLMTKPFPQPAQKRVEAADPWAHRSEGMRCRTCMWWVKKVMRRNPNPDGEMFVQLGRCRRHAPTMSGFPAAYEDDWCGDHKLNESIR